MKVTTCQIFQAGFQSILLMGLPEAHLLINLKRFSSQLFLHITEDDDIHMDNVLP